MMHNNNLLIKIGALAGIAACAGDIIMTLVMGNLYPGYNQFTDTMSKLGASHSPVGKTISCWWIIMSFLFLIMALGFRARFHINRNGIRLSFWLILLYGFGEGMGSGVFPADHIPNGLTISLIVHNALGGIGIAAIIILPFILKSEPPFSFSNTFKVLSRIVSCFGPILLLLFTLAKLPETTNCCIFIYRGLWQRLLMLNYYVYLVAIAIMIWKTPVTEKTGIG